MITSMKVLNKTIKKEIQKHISDMGIAAVNMDTDAIYKQETIEALEFAKQGVTKKQLADFIARNIWGDDFVDEMAASTDEPYETEEAIQHFKAAKKSFKLLLKGKSPKNDPFVFKK